MKKICTFCLLFAALATARAQLSFEKIIGEMDGEDVGRSVIKTSDDGYAVVGKKEMDSNIDVYLLKTDANGATIWETTFGVSSEEDAYSVIQNADGGFTVLGLDYASGTFLSKTNASGDLLWTKSVAPEIRCYDFVKTPDDGYALVGEFIGSGQNYYTYLIRTNSSGDTLWMRKFGDPGEINTPYSLALTDDGGFVLTGETTSSPSTGENDLFLIKTDANGNLLWDKRFGTPALIEQGYSVLQTSDGGFLVGGTVVDALTEKSAGFLVKTDADGDTIWTRRYGFPQPYLFNQIESIAPTSDGGYALCGWAGSLTGNIFGYLIRTNAVGNAILFRDYLGAGICTLRSVVQADDGELVATGFTQASLFDLPDIYFFKTADLVSTKETESTIVVAVSPNPAAKGRHWQVVISSGQENYAEHRWVLSAPDGSIIWELNTVAAQVEVPVPPMGNQLVLTVQSKTGATVSRKLLSVD